MQKIILKNWLEKKQSSILIYCTWLIFLGSAAISSYLIGEIMRLYLYLTLSINTIKHDTLIKEIQWVEERSNFMMFGVAILLTVIMISVTIKYMFKLRIP